MLRNEDQEEQEAFNHVRNEDQDEKYTGIRVSQFCKYLQDEISKIEDEFKVRGNSLWWVNIKKAMLKKALS